MRLVRDEIYEPEICPHCGAPSEPRLLVAHIQATVAAYYGIPPRHMTSERRDREFAHPRQVAMYLACEMTPKSTVSIGRLFGGRDHSTVLYAMKSVQRRMCSDAEFALDIRALRERLTAPVDNRDNSTISKNLGAENAIEQTMKTQARIAA